MSVNINFTGAVFDLDGTLLDSLGVWAEIDEAFLARRGIAVPADYAAAVSPLSFREAANYTITRFSLEESPDTLMAEWDEMVREEYRNRIPLKDGACEYLSQLRNQGVRLAVATALQPELCGLVLRRCGIWDWFQAFAYVGEVNRGKGFPDIYLLAAERLGIPPGECMVFEDIPAGVAGAKAGGFFTCGVWDIHSLGEQPELERLSDYYIHGFHKLLLPNLAGV